MTLFSLRRWRVAAGTFLAACSQTSRGSNAKNEKKTKKKTALAHKSRQLLRLDAIPITKGSLKQRRRQGKLPLE